MKKEKLGRTPETQKGYEAGKVQSIPVYILYTKDYTTEFRNGYLEAKGELEKPKTK